MEILIVEDDFISRSLLKKTMNEMGHRVVEAEDGQQAWGLLQKRPIQVVLTDWMMPEMDGLELCRNIRSTAFGGYVYVIVLTARDRKKDLVEVFKAGADDYIPKPFDPEELNARVLTGLRVIDLEERHKRMQHNLIESRNKLKTVLDSIPEQIVAVDHCHTIVSVNKAFCDSVGMEADELLGMHWFADETAGAGPIRRFNIDALIKSVFEQGQAQYQLVEDTGENEQITYRQVNCLPIKDSTAQVVQVLVISKDVSEDRRKSEEIQALKQRLTESAHNIENNNQRLRTTLEQLETTQSQMLQSEKMASIGQLAAGVAHEINNPTGFVNNNLKTLNSYQQELCALIARYRELFDALKISEFAERFDDGLKEKFEIVSKMEQDIEIDFLLPDIIDLISDCREGARRIKKIVLDLKAFAHPGEEILQSMDINQGLESTLNVVNNEIKYKARVKTDFGNIPFVRAYPQQLNQVFMNILVNAAQAIVGKGDISIKTRTGEGCVEVAISDNGCGIPRENLSKIFNPFFTTKEVGKGTGIGMHIAHNIVQKHNGTIEVQSEVGKGTTFLLRFPLNP